MSGDPEADQEYTAAVDHMIINYSFRYVSGLSTDSLFFQSSEKVFEN
jgi:hypothetical protein